jgi:hypothetical protein
VTELGKALAELVARHGGVVDGPAVDRAMALLESGLVQDALPPRQVARIRAAKFLASHVKPELWRDPETRARLKAEVAALVELHDGTHSHVPDGT